MFSAKINKLLDIGLKVSIFIIVYGFLFNELFSNGKWSDLSSFFVELRNNTAFYPVIVLVFILMFANWGIESFKWKFLIRRKEQLPFISAFYSILAGVTISSFVPARMGEFLGRIFILKTTSKWKGAFVSLAGSFSQFITTIFFGALGVLSFYIKYKAPYLLIFTIIVFAILFLLLLFYFNFSIIRKVINNKQSRRYRKWALYVDVLSSIPKQDLITCLLLSLLRYSVFATQYYLLFIICGIQIQFFSLYSLIWVIYLIMACIPSFALADIGIRGSVSIMVFKLYFAEQAVLYPVNIEWAIITASTLIWFINLFMPAIAGTFFLYKLQFFKRKVIEIKPKA